MLTLSSLIGLSGLCGSTGGGGGGGRNGIGFAAAGGAAAGGSAAAGAVTAGTCDRGLGGSGGNGGDSMLSTYKELCSVVSDIGQPDLLYKFMEISNHQKKVNRAASAGAGIARIAKKAGMSLSAHSEQLAPRLYRLRKDVNLNMRETAEAAWQTLVAAEKEKKGDDEDEDEEENDDDLEKEDGMTEAERLVQQTQMQSMMNQDKDGNSLSLPLSRVKRIMKLDKSIKVASGDATKLITKATELFCEMLTQSALGSMKLGKRKTIKYLDVERAVLKKQKFDFLHDHISAMKPKEGEPKKMTEKDVEVADEDGENKKEVETHGSKKISDFFSKKTEEKENEEVA